MIDKQTIDDVDILYICSYGQTELPICVDLEHRHCKLKSQKSKKCNLRPVVSYKDYERKEQECEELKEELKHYKQIAQYHGNLSVKYTNKSVKYKQTLTEIKEIAERSVKTEDYLLGMDFTELVDNILQKISEGLNDD